MTNPEKSFAERNGIPLKVSRNTGRVRRGQFPWLSTFTTQRGGTVADRSPLPAPADLLQPAEDELEGNSAWPPAAANDRSLAEKTLAARDVPRDVPQYIDAQESGRKFGPDTLRQPTGADAQGETAASGVSPLQGMPGTLPPDPDSAEARNVLQPIIAAAPEGTAAQGPAAPGVLTQRVIEIKAPFRAQPPSPLETVERSDAGRSGLIAPSFPPVRLLEMPMAYSGQISAVDRTLDSTSFRSNKADNPPLEFEGQSGSRSMEPSAEADFLNIVSGREESRRSASTESPRFIRTPQHAILERLNQQSSREEGSPKRVHIGTVHITVQRPGPPLQTPAPSISPMERERQAPAPIFINPWDRHYSLLG